ncbi:glycoside hydrolase family 97 protein [Marinoscillum furvescens]|uniref:Alpha-glucosidase n=1 Tax=Marinoscillum furvescens DSM 4134 TaxID=1122208 RepID=A0A3D9KZH6_MARFU|nr:glycoside hydrolase family 97 protein [Marinoscillum furvescens]RED95967.1 alpha-glucosidase [Marinoscillum furvescens DSM 4134]
MNRILSIFLLWCLFGCEQKQVTILKVESPNGKNAFVLYPEDGDGISFQIMREGKKVIQPSEIDLLSKDLDFSGKYKVTAVEEHAQKSSWNTRFGERSLIPDVYNELTVMLESPEAKLKMIIRAYDEGLAFAYEIPEQRGLKFLRLDDELISYQFDQDYEVWSTPERKPGLLTAQGEYQKIPISQLKNGAERPLLIEYGQDLKIALAEAKLVDYARLSYNANPGSSLAILSSLDGRLEKTEQDTITGALKSGRSSINKVKKELPFQSPWRVIMMGESYGELLENNYLIQNLNDPNELEDDSWITPGKVLRETTLTTQGALQAIDFVAAHNMQYVHFDAGWYGNEMDDNSDATTLTLDPNRSKGPFDLEKITAYANERGVKVMLYVNRRALEKQLDDLLPLFKEWGIAGIKYGFVRVGDQDATAWLHDAIKKTAQYELIVDVHDEYRPTGFSRTYPNLLTQEGIAGDETSVSNEHTLITMFTRMLAGAADNTVCYYNSRVEQMGSHASQLAKTVCLFSPLQFLYWYDKAPASPEKLDGLWGDTKTIGNEPELEFFDNVPTTWDETRVLVGEIGKIGVIARRKGNDWFVGGINGPEARTVTFDLDFLLSDTSYTAKVYTDDESVDTRTHVRIEEVRWTQEDNFTTELGANEGFALHIEKDNTDI